MPIMTGARAMVETMTEYDTELVVGYIGHCTHELADALTGHPTIRSFPPATEYGGGSIVNGYNYVKGRPAALAAWHSVGSFVASGPIFEAQIGRIPSIHLGFNVDGTMKDREAMQEMPNHEVFRNITKFSTRVERPDKLPEALHKAFQLAQVGRLGPAFIDIPFDITIDEADMVIPRGWKAPSVRQTADPADVEQILDLLLQAERPVLLVGGGGARSGAGPEVLALAEALALPVATSSTAMGILPEDHPLSLGLCGTIGWPIANEAIRTADVVLVAGSRLSDWGYAQAWAADLPGRLIHIDNDPEQIGAFYFPELGIVGDVKAVLGQLVDAVQRRGAHAVASNVLEARRARTSEQRESWLGILRERWASDEFPMSPWRVVHDVQAQLDDDDIIVVDAGSNTSWVFQGTVVRKPYTLLAPFGVGNLGTAFPMGIGAKLAAPDSKVVVMTGDGGFHYTFNEMSTAVREDIPVVAVVFNNGYYGSNLGFMNTLYGHAEWVKLANPDFAAIARAYGGYGETVSSADEVGPAVQRAFESGLPAIIDVPINPDYGYSATGAGPTIRWEPRLWPGDPTGAKRPGKLSDQLSEVTG